MGRWFYRLSQGGWVYTDRATRTSVAYARVFKCGSTQMEAYGLHQLAPIALAFESFPPGPSFQRATMEALCTLLVIRDPVEHFLAGYNEVEMRLADHKGTGGLSEPLRFLSEPVGSTERFVAFVEDLLVRADQIPEALARGLLTHVLPQANALLGLPAPSAVTFVHLAEIQLEVPKAMREGRCSLPASSSPPMKRAKGNRSSADPLGTLAAAQTMWASSGPVARALCALHAMDYACLDVLTLPIACADVLDDPGLLGSS